MKKIIARQKSLNIIINEWLFLNCDLTFIDGNKYFLIGIIIHAIILALHY